MSRSFDFAQAKPFSTHADPQWFHLTPGREEALSRLLFLLETGRRFAALLGEAGVGKTLLLKVFLDEARRLGADSVYVDAYGLTERELLDELCGALGLPSETGWSSPRALRAVEECLHAADLTGRRLVVCLDHLDRADPSGRLLVTRLVHRSTRRFTSPVFVLAVRIGHVALLGGLIEELADLRVDLGRLSLDETVAYVTDLLQKAGQDPNRFDVRAVEAIHAKARGLPREINRLCELCLLAAQAEQRATVGTDVVEAASAELVTTPTR